METKSLYKFSERYNDFDDSSKKSSRNCEVIKYVLYKYTYVNEHFDCNLFLFGFEAKHANFIINFFSNDFQIYMYYFVEDTTIHERKHSRKYIRKKRKKIIVNKNVKIFESEFLLIKINYQQLFYKENNKIN